MESLIFYIIVFMIVFLLNIIGKKFYKNNKAISYIFIIASFTILLFLYGVRYQVGTDYKSYIEYYEIIKYTKWVNLFYLNWEKGFLIILKLYSLFIKEPRLIFFLFGFLTLFPIYKINKDYDFKYLPMSIIIFCFIFLAFSFNGMRQAVAMSFVLWSFNCVFNKKNKAGIIILVISIFLHKSSIIIIPFFILLLLNKEKPKEFQFKSFLLTILISVLILFFLKDLLASRGIISYSSYLNRINTNNISYKALLLHMPTILIVLIFHKKNNLEIMYSSFVFNGIIFEIIGTAAQYLSRIALYFTCFEIILLPVILDNLQIKYNRVVLNILYVIYIIIYFYFQFYISGRHEIFPYQTWLPIK